MASETDAAVARREREWQEIREKWNSPVNAIVPVVLDIDSNGYVVKDYFLWDTTVDLDLPPTIVQLIAKKIREQIEEGTVYNPSADNGEHLATITLDIRIGDRHLLDKFLWDLNNPAASPTEYASVYCREMQLGGEWPSAVARAIIEQIQRHVLALHMGAFVPKSERVVSAVREVDDIDEWSPRMEEMSDENLQKLATARAREMRYHRRSTNPLEKPVFISVESTAVHCDGVVDFRKAYASHPIYLTHIADLFLGGKRSVRLQYAQSKRDRIKVNTNTDSLPRAKDIKAVVGEAATVAHDVGSSDAAPMQTETTA